MVSLTRIGRFVHPVLIASPPSDPHRVAVVEQRGLVRLLVDGDLRPAPFLDLRGSVRVGSEDGLLGLAFAPDYASSGLLYVVYNDLAGDLRLVELRRSADDPDRVDPASARDVLTIPKFSDEHNGGMLEFGLDGLLYAGVGDGGASDAYKPGFFA
jgi:glucose/arabinose dehydrogenase